MAYRLKRFAKRWCLAFIAILITVSFILLISTKLDGVTKSPKKDQPPEYIDFEDFDNKNGTSYQIVPNIVHYIFLNKPKIEFYHMVNIFSLFFNHRPDKIYFHCDNCSFSGKYFEALKSNKELWNLIEIHPIPFHVTIFGQHYKWINHHR